MKQFYCGIDTHKDEYVGCIIDEKGNTIREHKFPPTKEATARFITGIPSPNIKVAIEACGMWRGAHKMLTELGYDVRLANPKKTHDIASCRKTDKVDARILADLLRTNYLPEVYIPDETTLRYRDLVRHKSNLTRLRVQVQLKIKGYLLRAGIKYERRIWTEKALKELGNQDPNIRNLINVYWSLKTEEKEVMKRIKNISKKKRHTNLLMTMPGIGEYGSLMILAEIGDIKRFTTPKQLVSYAGLCPGIHQSGNKEKTTHNKAVNKWLKWIIVECSGRASMLDPQFQQHYYKIKQRKGFQTARRSTARKMLTTIWHMLTKEQPYHSPSKTFEGRRAPPGV